MRISVAVLAGLTALCLPARAQDEPIAVQSPLHRSSPEEYGLHLQQLQAILQTCSARRTADACDPGQVGPDEVVITSAGPRQIHYDWLRTTLANASGKPQKKPDGSPAKPLAPNEVKERLQAATDRLAQENTSPSTSVAPVTLVRRNLDSVLTQRDFRRVQDPNLLARAEAKAWQWIFEHLGGIAAFGGRNPWIARVLEWAAISLPCLLLLWWIMLRLRRPAVGVPPAEPVALSAPSAREWQRWLQEAEGFAQQQRWRDAVHHVYWAAISRMESRGLWPADRARTPREYLALLHRDHALLSDLRQLTRSFERIWYGHRSAEEQQYRDARSLLERLASK